MKKEKKQPIIVTVNYSQDAIATNIILKSGDNYVAFSIEDKRHYTTNDFRRIVENIIIANNTLQDKNVDLALNL